MAGMSTRTFPDYAKERAREVDWYEDGGPCSQTYIRQPLVAPSWRLLRSQTDAGKAG